MKVAGIDLKDALHEFGEVCGLQGLKEKVEMIGHEAIMEDQDAVFIKIQPKDMRHPHIIIVRLEYGSSVVSPRHYVIQAIIYDMSGFSWHGTRLHYIRDGRSR